MGLRVLLLDDDAPFVAEAQASLEGAGCEVTSLRSGDSGLARATTDRFDVVVASAELPSVNGFRLCNRMKKDPAVRGVPVLLLTTGASASSAEAHRLQPTRADVYLQKPIVMAELVAQVRARLPAARPPMPTADEPTMTALRLAPAAPAPPPLPALPTAVGPALPPQRGRAKTMVGVAPAPKTQPPPPRGSGGDETIQRLARELSAARREAEATAPLRARIAELQDKATQLTGELAEARAAAAAATTEAERLKRERASLPPPPSVRPPANLAELRESLRDKDHEILTLRTGLESEQQAAAEAYERLRALEEAGAAHEQSARKGGEELAQADKRLAVLRAQCETASRRADDAGKRADKLKAELASAHAALDQEKATRTGDAARLAEARAASERQVEDAREKATGAQAERERAVAEQLAGLRAEHATAVAGLERQLSEARLAAEAAAASVRGEAERLAQDAIDQAQRDFDRRLEVTVASGAKAVEGERKALRAVAEERDRLARELASRPPPPDPSEVRDETERRVAELQSAHAVAMSRLQDERDAELARLRGEHEREVDRLRQDLLSERARSDEARHAGTVSGAAAEQFERRIQAAQQAAALGEERRASEVADARAAAEAALARLDHEQVKMELQRDSAIADATLELRVSLAKAIKERDEVAAAARARVRAETESALQAQREADLGEATAELRIELEGARAAAIAEMKRAQATELQRLEGERVKERAEVLGRVDAIERALTAAREALEKERRARLEERTSAAARIDALEDLARARNAEVELHRRDADEAHSEMPALEAENRRAPHGAHRGTPPARRTRRAGPRRRRAARPAPRPPRAGPRRARPSARQEGRAARGLAACSAPEVRVYPRHFATLAQHCLALRRVVREVRGHHVHAGWHQLAPRSVRRRVTVDPDRVARRIAGHDQRGHLRVEW